MIVRPARQEDIPVIAEIMEQCDLTADGVPYDKWTGVVLVADRQAQVIGFIAALPGAPYAIVTAMAVLPEHRKGRAASKLIDGMRLILASLGCVTWAAFADPDDVKWCEALEHVGQRAPKSGVMYRGKL